MKVEVFYAAITTQRLIQLEIAEASSVLTAIQISQITTEFPEIDLNSMKVGIFSRIVALEDKLQQGDRIEIYRPLIACPKQKRRERAALVKKQRQARKD